MPYDDVNSAALPDYIKKLPSALRARWIKIFNSILETNGEEMAFIVANKWLTRQIKPTEMKAKTENTRQRITFKIDSKQLIKKTESGEEYISAVLADEHPDSEGDSYTPEVLKKFADSINKNLPVGDVDHELYTNLLESNISDEGIIDTLKKKKGIAKAVKAIVDKGKLWLRILIDKRYRNVVNKAKGLSIEALVNKDENGKIYDGEFLGFTFGVKHNPVNERAVIV